MTCSKNPLKIISLLFFSLLLFQNGKAQNFGKPSKEELAMTNYPADPEAAGVVLYEKGNYKAEVVNNYVRLIKEIYVKTKVLDAKKFKQATIEIPYYREKGIKEEITKLTAITHNGRAPTYLSKTAIFDIDETENWSMIKFTFPDVQDGSILEYTYRVVSPYFFNLGSWNFQGPLPVIYSEFHTEIPGNFFYNRTMYGSRKLNINRVELKKNCFQLPDNTDPGDCESATYVMENVPALKQERYMLSEKNYISRIKYELVTYTDFRGKKTNYSETWADADKTLRLNKDLGRQLKYDSYFKERLPASILSISDDLERAKAVYYYFQEKLTWNGKYRILSDIRVKDAFDQEQGNSSEINLGLINALKAVGLDAKIMLIATRDRHLPTNLYPVLSDFNYALVFLKINEEKYLLDATDKHNPFGVLPFRALNVEGRILDFDRGSYWEPIVPVSRNMHYVNMQLTADETGIFNGEISEVSTGYISVGKRKEYNDYNKEYILKKKQGKNEALDISFYEIENQKDLELPYKEKYKIKIHEQPVANKLYLFPFVMETYFSENPFAKEGRQYPINLGFPIINTYLVSIDLKDQYNVVEVPENKVLKLPGEEGELSVGYDVNGDKINIRLNLKLNNYSYGPEAYQALQQFFASLIKAQTAEPIVLQKI